MTQDPAIRDQRLGLLLVAGAAVAWSTAGLFNRTVALDPWTMLVWRSLFGGLVVAAWVAFVTRGHVLAGILRLGPPGLLVALAVAVAMASFMAALERTSVAAVMVLQATAPFFAAALAWVWMREPITPAMLLAGSTALAGVVVMVGGAWRQGSPAGMALALVMTIAFAVAMVVMRRQRQVSMMPANLVAIALTVLVGLPFATPLLAVEGPALLWLGAFGIVQMGLGTILFTSGVRRIPAAQTALVGLIEVVLAPLWVWVAFAEVPIAATLAGGGLILAAVLGHTILSASGPAER
jgi:drug/metabolite transporter (DMT)-like permease